MLIYGSRARHENSYKLQNIPCSHCEQTETQTMSFFTRYGYLYWIPFIPLSKVSVTECDHCKKTSAEDEYTPALKAARENLAAEVSSPKWYWAGSAAILGLVLFSFVAGAIGRASDNADYRYGLLKADMASMTNTPSEESDSLAYYLDELMTEMIVDDLEPENVYYLTKSYGANMLVLMSIPHLNDVEDEGREEIMPLITEIVESIVDVSEKNVYYGVMNNSDRFMMVKTPKETDYSSYADKNLLFDFYGEPIDQ